MSSFTPGSDRHDEGKQLHEYRQENNYMKSERVRLQRTIGDLRQSIATGVRVVATPDPSAAPARLTPLDIARRTLYRDDWTPVLDSDVEALLDVANAALHFVEEVNTFKDQIAAVESKLPMRDALLRLGMVRDA